MIVNLQHEILRVKNIIARLKEEDWGSADPEHRVEDAVDDDEEVENRRRRRRRIDARASGRVAAGIGSSLEIAVGWLPHRLGRFIRGFLGGRSGERATRRRLETGPKEDRLIVGNREIVSPFHALRPTYNLRERVVVRERERKGEPEESRREPGEVSAQFSLLSLPPRDAFVFFPRSHFPPLWLPFRSSFSRSSRVSSTRRCYFRASVLCKCRTRIKVAISTRSPIGQVIVWGIINLTPSNQPS